MSIADSLVEVDEKMVPEEKLLLARRERDQSNRKLAKAEQDKVAAEKALEAILDFTDSKLEVPKWLTPKPSKGIKRGIATLLVSDTHFDEVVEPSEIEGLNKYNREIATMRLRTTFEKAVSMPRDYLTGLKLEGAMLFLGGDMVTGVIHEELAQSNDAFLTETVLYWTEQLAAGIELLKAAYGKVHVAGVVGNHGRMTMKPRSKGRAKDNWDWLIYKILERDFKKDSKVTFQVGEGSDEIVQIYDYKFRLTHGDQFSGGGGIGGLAGPVSNGDAKKRRLALATGRDYDYLCFTEDIMVLTSEGNKPIKDVKVGDLVFTHKGNWKKVYDVGSRHADSTVVVRGAGHPALTTTPEHPFLASERLSGQTVQNLSTPEWVEAKNMLGKYWHSPSKIDGLAIPDIEFNNPINKVFKQDEMFWFIVGLWLADGHIVKNTNNNNYPNGISLSLNINQQEIFEKRISGGPLKFTAYPHPERGVAVMQTYSHPLAVWLKTHFGEYSYGKRIPGWAYSLSDENRQSLLDGYLFGDGHYPESHRWEANSVSKSLSLGVKLLAQTLGQHTSMYLDDRGGVVSNFGKDDCVIRSRWKVKGIVDVKRWVGTSFEGTTMAGRVKSLTEQGPQQVYNISVEDDESYVADGIVVHNCLGHFHSYMFYNNIIANSSTKGYDEYAYHHSFSYEPPQQAFWITTPEHGVTFPIPLLVQDREKEGW